MKINISEIILIVINLLFFWSLIIFFDIYVIKLNDPWAETSSNHPWSVVFNKRCLIYRNGFIINCVEIGVRNHIVEEASWFIIILKKFDFKEVKFGQIIIISIAADIVIINGKVLISEGKNDSWEIGIICQLMIVPAEIAPIVNRQAGNIIFISLLLIWWTGSLFIGDHKMFIVKRIEYNIVRAVDNIKRKIIIQFVLENRDNSKIISFE